MRTLIAAVCAVGLLAASGSFADEESAVRETEVRDPFWPVGYSPPKARVSFAPEQDLEPVVEEEITSPLEFSEFSAEEAALIRKHTTVAGIMKSGEGFHAIINNQVVRPGDVLNIHLQQRDYNFLVRSITTERVALDYIREKEPEEGKTSETES